MGSKGGNKQSSVSMPNPQVMANYNAITQQAAGVAQTPFQKYTGEMVAPWNSLEQAGAAAIPAASTAYQPYFGTAQNLIGQGTQKYTPTQFSPEAISQYENPYTQDVIDATMANINQENAKQQASLQGNAIASGAWGGDRADLARNDLARQQSLASGQTIAGLENQKYQQALGQFNTQNQLGMGAAGLNSQTALQGAGLTGTLGNYASQFGLAGAQGQLQAGALQQQTQQMADTAAQQQFQAQQAYPFNTTQWLANIYNAGAGGMGGTSMTSSPGASGLSQALGAALSVASIRSDRRVKEDIHRVGKLDNGLPVYTYKYKGSPQTQMGLMAQDVEKENPSAVHELGGIKAVNYEDATKGEDGKYRLGGIVEYARGGYIPDLNNYVPESPIIEIKSDIPAAPNLGGQGGQSNNPFGSSFMDLSGLKNLSGAWGGANTGQGIGTTMSNLFKGSSLGGGYYGPGFKTGGGITGYADGGATDDPQIDFYNALAARQAENGVSQGQNPSLAGLGMNGDMSVPKNMSPIPGLDGNVGDNINEIVPSTPAIAAQSSIPVAPSLSQNAPESAPSAPSALSDLQKELKSNEPQLSKQQAMLMAGLSMAAGTSRNPIQNIAQGAISGLQNYAGQQQAIREYKLKEFEAEKQAEQLAAMMQRNTYGSPVSGMGTDAAGKQVAGVYVPNKKTGEMEFKPGVELTKPSQAASGLAEVAQDPEIKKLRGDDFYNAVKDKSPDYADRVYRLAKGLDAWPTPAQVNKNPELAKEISDAAKYDSGANAKRWVNAAKWDDSTSFTGKKLIAGNTAVSHMGMLMDAINAQKNGNIPALNAIRLKYLNETGSELPTNLDIDKAITLDEVAKFVIPGVGAQADREQFANTMKAAGSPEQLKGGMRQYYGLMRGQMNSMRHAYETETGRKDFDRFLDPDVKEKIGSKSTNPKYSDEDIAHTAKIHNMTVDEVKKRLGVD